MMPPKDAAIAALAWWTELRPDRAAFARLRRCATVAEAMQEQATMRLFRRIAGTGPWDLPPAALTASVLAHVRNDMPGSTVMRLMGAGSPDGKGETALLKPLRFRRLMEAETADERLTMFRRLVALAPGGALPVQDLARALLCWDDRQRQRWVLDYWNALPAQPASNPSSAPNPTKDATP